MKKGEQSSVWMYGGEMRAVGWVENTPPTPLGECHWKGQLDYNQSRTR